MDKVTECPIDTVIRAAGIAADNGETNFAIALAIAVLDSRKENGIQRVKTLGLLDGIRYEAEVIVRTVNGIYEDENGANPAIPDGHIPLYRMDADLDFEFDSDSNEHVHGPD